jgi:hypothetical protein
VSIHAREEEEEEEQVHRSEKTKKKTETWRTEIASEKNF